MHVAGVQLGANPFKKITRAVGKAGRGVAKGVATGARVAVKTAVDVHKLPIKLMIQASAQAARVVCGLPPPALAAAAAAAGLGPAAITTVPIFCKAVRAGAIDTIRKLLPQMLKIAAGAAAGAFSKRAPAAIPDYIPAAEAEIDEVADEGTMEGADFELLGYLAAHDETVLESALNGASDEEIRFAVGAPPVSLAAGVALGIGILAAGTGLFLALRR